MAKGRRHHLWEGIPRGEHTLHLFFDHGLACGAQLARQQIDEQLKPSVALAARVWQLFQELSQLRVIRGKVLLYLFRFLAVHSGDRHPVVGTLQLAEAVHESRPDPFEGGVLSAQQLVLPHFVAEEGHDMLVIDLSASRPPASSR